MDVARRTIGITVSRTCVGVPGPTESLKSLIKLTVDGRTENKECLESRSHSSRHISQSSVLS